ncbi:MAG: C-type lectin domain-containing protein [Verrucomicrobia bacterium]|nr:C-type lectin domain-containing protein [Verrucomicrobiota bacterium]
MRTNRSFIIGALILLLVPSLSRGVGVLAGPFTNTANAHLCYLLTQSTWTDAEAKALTLGGHLVTINDAAENQWVFGTFSALGGVRRLLWIGLTDIRSMGNFQWSSGQPRTYVNWSPVEPNNVGAERYTLMYPAGIPADAFDRYPGTWNNLRDWTSDIGLPCHGVIEIEPSYWIGNIGFWSNTNLWVPVYPNPNSVVVLKDGFLVKVDVLDAQVGALTLAPGSTVQVQPGGALAIYGPAVNNGTMNLSGDVTSYAGGDAFVQNGTLTIGNGVAMKGFDSGGHDFAFIQTGGATTVGGLLDFGNGIIQVQGGTLEVQSQSAMRGFDAGGHDLAYFQTGGTVTIDGTFETSNAGLQGGTLGGSGVIAGSLAANGGVL